jgi:GT2 family glycosyltransferase
MRVVAILASHNRRELTLRCLASYFSQRVAERVELGAVLVDDGSADGTSRAVRERFPGAEVVEGDGSLFWSGAMALAEQVALDREPDYLLWLNDDVRLEPDALSTLIETSGSRREACIAVGALRDPVSGELTYSGVNRRGLHPLRIERVQPGGVPLQVDTFNGNLVLVPCSVVPRVGPIDGALVHSAGDFDYGLRAADKGVAALLAGRTLGTCARDGDREQWLDPPLALRERLRLVLAPKGFPPRERARFLVRHGGPAWFVFWLSPYVRIGGAIVRLSLSRRLGRGAKVTRNTEMRSDAGRTR